MSFCPLSLFFAMNAARPSTKSFLLIGGAPNPFHRKTLLIVAIIGLLVVSVTALFTLWLLNQIPFWSSPLVHRTPPSVPKVKPVGNVAVVNTMNSQLQYDVNGLLVNSHAGGIYQFPHLKDSGLYYMYGDTYTDCRQSGPVCNQTTFCGYFDDLFSLYTSYDLVRWSLASGSVFPLMNTDSYNYFYFTPNVGYNNITRLFYLTFTGSLYGGTSLVPFATSTSPYGPFSFAGVVQLANATTRISSTLVLFVDPISGRGYVRYNTADSPQRHVIEELNEDWTAVSGCSSWLWVKPDYPYFEAGAFFYRKGWYYNTIGTDACYAQWGASVLVFVAPSPLGPWSVQGNINPCANGQQPVDSFPSQFVGSTQYTYNPCSLTNVTAVNFTVPTQQFNVVQVGDQFFYFGERYNSAPDGQKWHDLQVLVPLTFNDSVSPPAILPLVFTPNVTIQHHL